MISIQIFNNIKQRKRNFISTVIYLPKEIVEMLPNGRIRTKGTMNGAVFALAPQQDTQQTDATKNKQRF